MPPVTTLGDERGEPLGKWFDAPPDQPMLFDPQRSWTARELRSTVAHIIDRVGPVPPGSFAVFLGGTDSLSAIGALALQLAGAVVAFLDDRFPAEYKSDVVKTIEPVLIAFRSNFADQAAPHGRPGRRLFDIDRLIHEATMALDSGELADAGAIAAGSGPSVVLYSSGSSGTPNGIVHTHESLAEMAVGLTGPIRIASTDRVAVTMSLGYMTAGTTLAGAWRIGAAVAFYDLHADGLVGLIPWLKSFGATYTRLPAGTLRSLFELPGLRETGLRVIAVYGESMYRADFERFRAKCPPGCFLRYTYGATESSIGGVFVLTPDDVIPDAVRFRPQSWVDTAIVDEDDQRIEGPGTGEVFIHHPALAVGYLGRPDLTAERFVQRWGRRYFRTSDIATFHVDGTFSVLGRRDQRLKVRGNNVEPSAVEEALRSLPSVREAVVVGQERPGGGTLLAAYVTSGVNPPPSSGELRVALGPLLPDFQIPSIFMFVDDLPRGSTGKIDRRLLQSRVAEIRFECHPEQVPETPTEERIHRMVTKLLGLGAIGRNDDLLDLGLDSLMMAELGAGILAEFGSGPSLAEILRAPTIADLAVWSESGSSVLVRLAGEPGSALIVLVPGAGASPAYLRPLARELGSLGTVVGASIPTVAVDASFVSNFARDIASAVRRAEPRTVILAGHSWGGTVVAETARLLLSADVRVPLVVFLDSAVPNDRDTDDSPVPTSIWRQVRSRLGVFRNRLRGEPEFATRDARLAHAVTGDARFISHVAALPGKQVGVVATNAFIITAADVVRTGPREQWGSYFLSADECSVRGGHAGFLMEPHLGVLGGILRSKLAEVLTEP